MNLIRHDLIPFNHLKVNSSGDFLNAFELSGMITGDIEQSSGDQMLQSPVSQPRRDSSSTNDSNNIGKPSLE